MLQALKQTAARNPRAPALLAPGRPSLSHGGLQTRIAEIAEFLHQCGIGPGTRVALVLPQGPDMGAALLGVAACAIAIPLHPQQTEVEFAATFAELGIAAILLAAGAATPARAAATGAQITVIEIAIDERAPPGTFSLEAPVLPNSRATQFNGPQDVVLILQTSGSTARPKSVPSTAANLVARARNLAAFYYLGPDDRCINLMPLIHGHGIYDGLLAPLVTGGSTFCAGPFVAERFFADLETLAPTWITAGFTFHQAILAAAQRRGSLPAYPSLRFLRSGSGALNPRVGQELETLMAAPVVGTYALTEAGTVAAPPLDPAKRRAGTAGVILDNCVGIMNDEGTLVPAGEEGEIAVRGAHVSMRYENEEAPVGGGWLRTGDLGSIDAEGYLRITGRLKEMINRGGEKIAPLEVDEALCSHPEVAEALAFAIPHKTLGEDVAAAVVPARGARLSESALRAFLQDKLSPFKIPNRIALVDTLPKGPTGKPQRRGAADALGLAQGPASNTPEDTPSHLESALRETWSSILGLKNIRLDDDFFRLGGDSLQAVELFAAIETQFGQSLPYASLIEANTIRKMACLIDTGEAAGSLVPIRAGGRRRPLFLVHGYTGEVLGFRSLADRLNPEQPVYALQSLGLDGRADPLGSIDEIAAHYIDEIRRIQPHGPYQLGGYSFGGRVAYVMARRLRQVGEEVSLLALIDSFSLHGQKRQPLGIWVGTHLRHAFGLSPVRAIAYLYERLENLARIVGRNLGISIYQRIYSIYRRKNWPLPRLLRRPRYANLLARKTYRAEPYNGDAVLFRGKPYAWMHSDAHAGWRELVKGRLETFDLPGSHDEILYEPSLGLLCERLEAHLAGTNARETESTLRETAKRAAR